MSKHDKQHEDDRIADAKESARSTRGSLAHAEAVEADKQALIAAKDQRLVALAEEDRRQEAQEIAAVVAHHTAAPNGVTPEMIAQTLEFLPHLRAEGNFFLQDLVALVDVLKSYGMATVPEANRLLGFMAEDIKPIIAGIDALLALLHPTALPLPLERKVK